MHKMYEMLPTWSVWMERMEKRWGELTAVSKELHLLSLSSCRRSLWQISCKAQSQGTLSVLCFTHAVCISLISPIQQLLNCMNTNPNMSGAVLSTQLHGYPVPNVYNTCFLLLLPLTQSPWNSCLPKPIVSLQQCNMTLAWKGFSSSNKTLNKRNKRKQVGKPAWDKEQTHTSHTERPQLSVFACLSA